MMLDPTLLFRKAVGQPDSYQGALLNSVAARQIVLASRQCGKSKVTSIKAAAQALFVPGSLTVIAAPSLKQSSELARSVFDAIKLVEPNVRQESTTRIELANRSRVIAFPGSEQTIRGYSHVALLICDEASRIPDEIFVATSPMQATVKAPTLIYLSSAWGKRGKFYEAWSGKDGLEWERHEVKAKDCARITPEFLANERKSMGELLYSQEYENVFLDDTTQIISNDLLDAAINLDYIPTQIKVNK